MVLQHEPSSCEREPAAAVLYGGIVLATLAKRSGAGPTITDGAELEDLESRFALTDLTSLVGQIRDEGQDLAAALRR